MGSKRYCTKAIVVMLKLVSFILNNMLSVTWKTTLKMYYLYEFQEKV